VQSSAYYYQRDAPEAHEFLKRPTWYAAAFNTAASKLDLQVRAVKPAAVEDVVDDGRGERRGDWTWNEETGRREWTEKRKSWAWRVCPQAGMPESKGHNGRLTVKQSKTGLRAVQERTTYDYDVQKLVVQKRTTYDGQPSRPPIPRRRK